MNDAQKHRISKYKEFLLKESCTFAETPPLPNYLRRFGLCPALFGSYQVTRFKNESQSEK